MVLAEPRAQPPHCQYQWLHHPVVFLLCLKFDTFCQFFDSLRFLLCLPQKE